MRIAPKATKGKGRQWKAHQSSSSNPETNKFRARAKLMRLKNLAVQAGHSTVAVDFNSMSLKDSRCISNSVNSLVSLKKSGINLDVLDKIKDNQVGKKRKRDESITQEEQDEQFVKPKKAKKVIPRNEDEDDDYSDVESDEDEKIAPKKQTNEPQVEKTRGIYRSLKPVSKSAPGSQFRATKAAGDMKRKGAPDPYAYLPLDRSALKKGNKGSKANNQFKGLVGAAKKGAIKGQKLRKRNLKK